MDSNIHPFTVPSRLLVPIANAWFFKLRNGLSGTQQTNLWSTSSSSLVWCAMTLWWSWYGSMKQYSWPFPKADSHSQMYPLFKCNDLTTIEVKNNNTNESLIPNANLAVGAVEDARQANEYGRKFKKRWFVLWKERLKLSQSVVSLHRRHQINSSPC